VTSQGGTGQRITRHRSTKVTNVQQGAKTGYTTEPRPRVPTAHAEGDPRATQRFNQGPRRIPRAREIHTRPKRIHRRQRIHRHPENNRIDTRYKVKQKIKGKNIRGEKNKR